jgi:2-C-methyl-D-erythritol 2,4-cyclodiphosphate synthase
MSVRVGIGYDIHILQEGRKLIIGGVEIPYEKGLQGHSDADVLLHALCDSLIGAMGMGDIGEHFPDDDPRYLDISSGILLKKVKEMADKSEFLIENIDAVIIAEEPRLSTYKEKMRQSICGLLAIAEGCVNIKAKTNEGTGAIGHKEAIASYCAVILTKKEKV